MKNNKYILFFIVIMFVFLAEWFCFAWCRVQYVGIEYKISDENTRYKKLDTIQNDLKIERAKLRSPNRLSQFAKKYLNLKEPTSEQIIILP